MPWIYRYQKVIVWQLRMRTFEGRSHWSKSCESSLSGVADENLPNFLVHHHASLCRVNPDWSGFYSSIFRALLRKLATFVVGRDIETSLVIIVPSRVYIDRPFDFRVKVPVPNVGFLALLILWPHEQIGFSVAEKPSFKLTMQCGNVFRKSEHSLYDNVSLDLNLGKGCSHT